MVSPQHIQKIPIFSRLNEEQLKIICAGCSEISFQKDAEILQQGTISNDLFILLSGQVRIFLSSEDGREIILDDLKEGDFFGEMSLLDDKPRSANARALTKVSVIIFSKRSFLRIIRENAEISISILSVMGQRLRKADQRLSTLAFMDVCGRVANFILELSKEKGEKVNDDLIKIEAPTHQLIADQIGSSREAVTKAIKSLVLRDFISVNGKEFYISAEQYEIF